MSGLEKVGFTTHLGDGRIFFSTHEAMETLVPELQPVQAGGAPRS